MQILHLPCICSDLIRLLYVKPICYFEVCCLFENVQCASSTQHSITQDIPFAAQVLTLISGVKMRLASRVVGGVLCTALSSKPCEEEWPPDTLILRMTFPVQFVDIF